MRNEGAKHGPSQAAVMRIRIENSKNSYSKACTPTSVRNFRLIAFKARHVSLRSSKSVAYRSRSTKRSIVSAEVGPALVVSPPPKTEAKLLLNISILMSFSSCFDS